jgi:phosphoglycerate kinase
VLLRVDFNVPLKEGKVVNDSRLRAALPTIRRLQEKGAEKIIMASRLGRPRGKVVEALRMAPVGEVLEKLLGQKVFCLDEVLGEKLERNIQEGPAGLYLLENLRFEAGETAGDPVLGQALARLADVFVFDAFGAAHRAHASVVGPSAHLPSVAGCLLEKEVKSLGRLLHHPESPFITIVGGAKVSDKVTVLENLFDISDHLLVGGAMAYTFLKAEGRAIGNSLCEKDKEELARDLLKEAQAKQCHIHLPFDHVCGREFKEETEVLRDVAEVPEDFMGLDIGSKTAAAYVALIEKARMLLWNGPMGVFEWPAFSRGTEEVGRAAEKSSAFSVVGGGDSVAAVEKFSLGKGFDHISSGGGASLEFLSGKTLPGIEALLKRKSCS